MAGPLDDAISLLGTAGKPAGNADPSAAAADYLNNPKNRAAVMADASRIAALRPGANSAPAPSAPAKPVAGPLDGAIGLLSGATPAAPAAPAATPATRHTGFADLPAAAAEPIATMATGALGGIIGGVARIGSAVLGNSPADAKATGEKVSNALTYQPQTEGGKASMAGLGDLASKAKNALMTSPVGPALQSVGNAYDNTFVKGATNPLMATVNDMLPTIAANVAGGKVGGVALDLARAAPTAVAGAAKAVPGLARAAIGRAETAPVRVEPSIPAPTSTLSGVGAASANGNPYPSLTGEVAARGGSSSFPQVKLSQITNDVPLAEQQVRAKIANEVLGDEHSAVREGVITGNEDTLRSEHTQARSSENTPSQLVLRNQIAKEQQALTDYAQARVEATGANRNLINNEQRGQVINDAFHGEGGLTDYFKQAKQEIYDRAKAESGGNPIQSKHVDGLLSDPQFLAEAERNGHTGVVSGAQKLIDLARTTGFKDPITGEVHAPGSVAAWDAVRKSNNAGWSPDNARTIAAINRAIDQDVSAAAGSDAYKLGDAIHKAEKTIMDTPAIKKIFGGTDANGIKDGAALEDLPKRLNNMPIDQWTHVHNTLNDLSNGRVYGAPEGMPPVPDELRQAAAAARNEMAGALAREVFEQGAGKAGVWNQNSANKVLNSKIGQKMLQTFPPDEIQRLHALNLAGQIMPGMHSYEGGAQQALRLGKQTLTEKVAGKVGAFTGGAAGAIINPYAAGTGAQTGKWVGDKIAGRSAAKRMEGESNKLLEAMRSNSRLGQGSQGNRLSN